MLGRSYVRSGSLADILRCGSYVRFTPKSGHVRVSIECLLDQRRIGSWECWEAGVGPPVLPDGVVFAPAVKEFAVETKRKNVVR